MKNQNKEQALCECCQGTGYVKTQVTVSAGERTLWNFAIFILLFGLMVGIVRLFGATEYAIPAIVVCVIIFVLLSTGVVDVATTLALFRDRRITCLHCKGTGSKESELDRG